MTVTKFGGDQLHNYTGSPKLAGTRFTGPIGCMVEPMCVTYGLQITWSVSICVWRS